MTPSLTAMALGIALALGILWLVRRDRLHGSYALWWLVVAAGSLVVAFVPALVDRFGVAFGVSYPPMLLAFVAIVVILFKLLGVDIDVTRREQKLRRLMQKVALLEADLQSLRDRLGPNGPAEASRPADIGSPED